MESIFKISRLGEFGLLIEGLESDSGQYLSEDNVSVSHRAYRWDHSVTINTISTLNSEGTETFKNYYIVNHEVCCTDRQELQLESDGLYRIAHIILPNRVWVDHVLATDPTALSLYNKVYFFEDNTFYLYNAEGNIEIDFSTIYNELPGNENTIIRSDKNTFAIYYLNNCFNTILKDVLKNLPNCNKDTKKINDRDILWMFINVIKYCLDAGKLYEAQRFLEKLRKCDIACNNNFKPTTNGCGC